MSHWEKKERLINRGRVVEHRTNLVWKQDTLSSKKPNKGSKKEWEESTQWLRTKIL